MADHWDNAFYSFNRWMAEEPADFPQAHITLHDALFEYLRTLRRDDRDMAEEGYVLTPAQERRQLKHRRACEALLEHLTTFEMDPEILKRRKERRNG